MFKFISNSALYTKCQLPAPKTVFGKILSGLAVGSGIVGLGLSVNCVYSALDNMSVPRHNKINYWSIYHINPDNYTGLSRNDRTYDHGLDRWRNDTKYIHLKNAIGYFILSNSLIGSAFMLNKHIPVKTFCTQGIKSVVIAGTCLTTVPFITRTFDEMNIIRLKHQYKSEVESRYMFMSQKYKKYNNYYLFNSVFDYL